MASGIGFRIRWFAALLLCLGWSTDIWCAESFLPVEKDPVRESWRWRTYRELEGRGLSCLTEGPDGKIFFGTDEGVRVYNGLRWGVYQREDGIVGPPVNALLTTRDGLIYAGTETSLLVFDGSGWEVVYPPEGDLHWRFTDLEEAGDGSIWAATNWGALHLDGDQHHLYTTDAIGKALRRVTGYVRHSVVPEAFVPKRPIRSRIGLLSAPAGANGVAENLLVYAVAEDGPADSAGVVPGARITSVDGQPLMDPNTALIGPPGTVADLEIVHEGARRSVGIVRVAEEETFRPFSVYDVMAARDGSVWFGLGSGEVLQFHFLLRGKGASGLWRLYTEEDGLELGELPRVGQSPDGQVWVVSYTQQGGVNRFDGVAWDHFRLSSVGGSDLNTSFATTDDGAFWIGGNTLNVLRDGTWTAYSNVETIPSHRTRLMVASDGALWVAGLGQHAARLSLASSRWAGYRGLAFQTESPPGTQWFLSDDNGAVRFDGERWLRYDTTDGIVAYPSAVYGTRSGRVWVVGSHEGSAATSMQVGDGFERTVHAKLSWNVDQRSVLEARDGSLWFGAWVDFDPDQGHLGGLMQYQDGKWIHHRPPAAPDFVYGIAQTPDGLLWFAGEEVKQFDGTVWLQLQDPPVLSRDWTDEVYATPGGTLWVGTRTHGVYGFDGRTWTAHAARDGLSGSRVYSIAGDDDALWVATDRGVSLYDGAAWVTHALSREIDAQSVGSLATDAMGNLWVSSEAGFRGRARGGGATYSLSTIRYARGDDPPDTEITVAADRVSAPGNTVFAWRGFDPFKDTPDDALQYAWRLNEKPWSRFDSQTYRLFTNLSEGKYRLEVVAMDRDLNVDPTPARFDFVVGN